MSDRHTPIRAESGGFPEGARPPAGRPRIALYSHDAMGIGHLRRNLLLAESFVTAAPGTTVLLISGTGESGAFPVVSGIDCLTLPALEKRPDGTYGARNLQLDARVLRELRIQSLRAALGTFRPDVLIVDKLPRGVLGELDQALADLRTLGTTRIVLGLRDILDAPGAIRAEWARTANEAVIARFYDAVWIYGDPNVYDPVREYGFGPAVTSRLAFTGYLDPGLRSSAGPATANGLPGSGSRRLVLCQVGGGQDGDRLAEAFARAELPPGTHGLILTGPFMPDAARRRLQHLSAARSDLALVEFTSRPEGLLRAADRIVAMGGYNTVCEALSLRKPLLVVPRVRPRCDQLIRAQRFAELGLLEILHPDRLSSEVLSGWLGRDLSTPRDARDCMDFQGIQRLPRLLEGLLAGRRPKGIPRSPAESAGVDRATQPTGPVAGLAARDAASRRDPSEVGATGFASEAAKTGGRDAG